jgi:hypothetical protein
MLGTLIDFYFDKKKNNLPYIIIDTNDVRLHVTISYFHFRNFFRNPIVKNIFICTWNLENSCFYM